jgi:hypothetical protein
MPSHDSEALRNSPEGTCDSQDSLEARFRRAYGREMTPEERKYFALVERFGLEPESTQVGKTDDLKNAAESPTTPVENPDRPDSGGSKAA